MTVTITGKITDVTARKDSRPWRVWSPVYREGANGEIVTITGQPVKVVGGIVTIELEPGVAVIENPDGQRYTVTIPDEDADLWGIIATAVAMPPDTAQEALAAAVASYLTGHPPTVDIPSRPAGFSTNLDPGWLGHATWATNSDRTMTIIDPTTGRLGDWHQVNNVGANTVTINTQSGGSPTFNKIAALQSISVPTRSWAKFVCVAGDDGNPFWLVTKGSLATA